MLFLSHTATLLLFPLCAVWAWRRGGSRALWVLTIVAIGAVLVLTLISASEQGGNRLVRIYGYTHTARRTLQFATLTWILPLVASAAAVRTVAPGVRSEFVYPIAAATALVAATAGIVVATYTLF